MFIPKVQQMATLITIQERKEENINGSLEFSWVDSGNPKAFCKWRNASNIQEAREESGVLSTVETSTVTMWYRPDITVKHRIIMNDEAYEIVSVDDVEQRHQFLVLKVRRVLNA